jgi:hypothetical protein
LTLYLFLATILLLSQPEMRYSKTYSVDLRIKAFSAFNRGREENTS